MGKIFFSDLRKSQNEKNNAASKWQGAWGRMWGSKKIVRSLKITEDSKKILNIHIREDYFKKRSIFICLAKLFSKL